ncbi:protein teflon [Drosophila tropicalis]|uniref:protein teflon n=1 Tax=Drosophila tropicalis TaxID=46794 RepID=UPI0035ABC0D3
MSSFLNLLPDGSNANLEKCGDVVISPKDNIMALFCRFCSDIFTRLPEFSRHLQANHSDILSFVVEQNVYSVEELLGHQDNEQDNEQSVSDSSSSGDSGLPERERDEEIIKDNATSELYACQSNANIMEALAANDIDLNDSLDNSDNVKDLKAEVESLLFNDDNNKADNHPEPFSNKETEKKTKILTESTYCQITEMESQKDTKGFRQSRSKTEKSSLSICDLKSYSITRMTRRREMKQMSSVRMRIIRSLQVEEMAAKPVRTPLNNLCSIEHLADDNIKGKSPLDTKKPLIENPKLPAIQESKENQKLLSKISSATSKPSLDPVQSTESFQKPWIYNVSSMPNNLESDSKKKLNGKFVEISKVEILPKLNLEQERSFEKPPQRRSANWEDELNPMPKKAKKETDPKPMPNTPRGESLEDNSQQQLPKCNLKDEPSRCPLNFSLSDSVIEFLQTDLKSTPLDGADSLLQLAMPKESESPSQLEMKPQIDQELPSKPNVIRDDLILLNLIGLPVVKYPTYVDKLCQDAYDTMREKATKFTQIFRNYAIIWNRRKFIVSSDMSRSLNHELGLLKEELNRKLHINLNILELKRLLNLINIWHGKQIELVYFQKVKLSSNIEYYFQLFNFLSKLNNFLFYCEYCEETLYFEAEYMNHLHKHRIVKRVSGSKQMKTVARKDN